MADIIPAESGTHVATIYRGNDGDIRTETYRVVGWVSVNDAYVRPLLLVPRSYIDGKLQAIVHPDGGVTNLSDGDYFESLDQWQESKSIELATGPQIRTNPESRVEVVSERTDDELANMVGDEEPVIHTGPPLGRISEDAVPEAETEAEPEAEDDTPTGPDTGEKTRRRRRTKAEMAAARALEDPAIADMI